VVFLFFSLFFTHKSGSNRVLAWVSLWRVTVGAGPDKLRASFQVLCAAPRHNSAPDAWAVNSVTSPDLCALRGACHSPGRTRAAEPCLLAFSVLFLDFFSSEGRTL